MPLKKHEKQISDAFTSEIPTLILWQTKRTWHFSDETIQEIVGIFETNSIEIRLQQSEINGLYEIGSMMEHSCVPNVRMSFDDKFNVSLYPV